MSPRLIKSELISSYPLCSRAENLTNEHNCLGVELRKETNVRPNQRTQMTKLTERIQIGEEYIREEIPAMSTRIVSVVVI